MMPVNIIRLRVEDKDAGTSERATWESAAPAALGQYEAHRTLDFSSVAKLRTELRDAGVAIVELLECFEPAEAMIQVLDSVGTPIRVFDKYSYWRPIGVDLNKAPSRSEGTGDGPFHMDFVNAANPPRYVCLYCVRPDPAGGGLSALSSIEDAVSQLDESDLNEISKEIYSDGQVRNLENIGHDINPFAILSKGSSWPYRYTGSLLAKLDSEYSLNPLQRLETLLRSRQVEFLLERSQALIFDNGRFVHARRTLGRGQFDISPENRRLLYQGFASD